MILKDGTTIPIVDGSYTGAVVLIAESQQAVFDTWALLTPDNLTEVRITHDDDTPLHTLHRAVVTVCRRSKTLMVPILCTFTCQRQ